MTDAMDEHEVRKFLAAFADGELDVEQNLRVLEHMAMNPRATRRVMHQQQLRQAVDRVLREHTQSVPAALKEQIAVLAKQADAAGEAMAGEGVAESGASSARQVTRVPVLARLGRLVPLAAAAVLFVAAIVVLNQTGQAVPVSQAQYAAFVQRHTNCSRLIEKLMHMEMFPQDLKQLPQSLHTYFGTAGVAGLDLSPIGYEFSAVGECNVPGKQSVHLIYQAKNDPEHRKSISLWMKRYNGSPRIESGKPYVVTDSGTANPLIVWQKNGMIYYLVGGSLGSVEDAASVLRMAG